MFSRFFIDRPIFASVLSIVITLAGAVAFSNLPLAQYPPITPPTHQVICTYPGASAQVVADSVAAPIEQQVNGVEDMMYMSSQSHQRRLLQPDRHLQARRQPELRPGAGAEPRQPGPAAAARRGQADRRHHPQAQRPTSCWSSASISPNGRYDQLYLSNYATIQVKDELPRVDGVGDVFLFGQQRLQHARLGRPGQAGGAEPDGRRRGRRHPRAEHARWPPATSASSRPATDRPFEFTLTTLGRLTEPRAVRRTSSSRTDARRPHGPHQGRRPRRAGRQEPGLTSKLDGQPDASLAIFQLPDANALDTADRVRAKMEELKKSFPEDVDYDDRATTRRRSSSESINEVVQDAASRPSSWSPSSCCCSCRTGGRRSSRWWRCRWPSSAPSPSWRPSASA